jgi:hypothetical protein
MFGGALVVARQWDAWRTARAPVVIFLVRDLTLTLMLALAILATPYGGDVWQYYRDTAGNPMFRQHITEWYPLWSKPAADLVGILFVVVTAVAAAWRQSDSFPVIVLSGLSVMLLVSVRHATPLALASLVLLPRLLDLVLKERWPFDFDEVPRLPLQVAVAVVALTFVVAVPWRANKTNITPSRDSVEARVAASSVSQCLLVDEQQGDRLVWFFPSLARRVSHTVRVETIPADFLRALAGAYAAPDAPQARAFWRRFPIVAMDDRMHADVIDVLAGDTVFTPMGRSGHLVVFQHRFGERLTDACAQRNTEVP